MRSQSSSSGTCALNKEVTGGTPFQTCVWQEAKSQRVGGARAPRVREQPVSFCRQVPISARPGLHSPPGGSAGTCSGVCTQGTSRHRGDASVPCSRTLRQPENPPSAGCRAPCQLCPQSVWATQSLGSKWAGDTLHLSLFPHVLRFSFHYDLEK